VAQRTWLQLLSFIRFAWPLLIGGSFVLSLLSYFKADVVIDNVLAPLVVKGLGLPHELGITLVFGFLRKELSLLMIYQALGTFDVGAHLDWVQILTFLIFLTFYFPCVSTFAVMLRTIGRRQALVSVSLSVGVALLVSGVIRFLLEGVQYFSA